MIRVASALHGAHNINNSLHIYILDARLKKRD